MSFNMTMTKKTPKRLCVACREMREKAELVRITKSKDGEISLDLTGKMPGRGAYICKSEECLKKARKTRALERAFSVNIEDAVYEMLAKSLSEAENE